MSDYETVPVSLRLDKALYDWIQEQKKLHEFDSVTHAIHKCLAHYKRNVERLRDTRRKFASAHEVRGQPR